MLITIHFSFVHNVFHHLIKRIATLQSYLCLFNCFQLHTKDKIILVLNSLPNDKILEWTKLKAIADDKIDVAKIMISVYNWVENIVGKGENAGYNVFQKFLSEGH